MKRFVSIQRQDKESRSISNMASNQNNANSGAYRYLLSLIFRRRIEAPLSFPPLGSGRQGSFNFHVVFESQPPCVQSFGLSQSSGFFLLVSVFVNVVIHTARYPPSKFIRNIESLVFLVCMVLYRLR
jgi:hypothetical protein